jgi:hypothetical protein
MKDKELAEALDKWFRIHKNERTDKNPVWITIKYWLSQRDVDHWKAKRRHRGMTRYLPDNNSW